MGKHRGKAQRDYYIPTRNPHRQDRNHLPAYFASVSGTRQSLVQPRILNGAAMPGTPVRVTIAFLLWSGQIMSNKSPTGVLAGDNVDMPE